MSTMFTTGVAVYFIEHEGVMKNITKAQGRRPHDKHLPPNAITLPRGTADGQAASRITTWITTNSMSKPIQLTIAALNIHTLETIVETYATAYAFRIPRHLRGDDLRDAIYKYMHQGYLTAAEFAMIVEWLGFDGGLVKTAKNVVMDRLCKGGKAVLPEMGKIEEYAKRMGLWEGAKGMEAIGENIKAGMAENDRKDAEGAQARNAGSFPALR